MTARIPILVGAGQNTNKAKSIEDFVHPIDAMKLVVERAAEDAQCAGLIAKADAIHVANILSWNLRDAPTALAEALGANPSIREYTTIGGDTPQWLVNRAADNLEAGRSEVAILAGCEVMRSVSLAMAAGADLGFFRETVQIPLVGHPRNGVNDIERDHQADRPIRIYPLIENALRAKEGLTLQEQRDRLGRFGESYSAIAAANPHAWYPISRSGEEIVTPTAKNRMISFPYTKYLNANNQVDQAAAVIMTTTEVAKRLGIPESRWIYLHGGQEAHDLWFVSDRPDIADSSAIGAIVESALAQAGLTLDAISFFDFYSCFPCMPRLTRRVLGIAEDDPRPMTMTGGLPYFGAPGNNFVMHSIAEAMRRCRANPEEFGMITSNGWYCTKHGVGIYGAAEPKSPWSRTPPDQFQAELALPPSLEIDPEPSGEFRVDGYTVWHDRSGEPEVGILCGRTAEGKRAWAQTPREDKDLMGAMMREEWVGRRGKFVGRQQNINLVSFS